MRVPASRLQNASADAADASCGADAALARSRQGPDAAPAENQQNPCAEPADSLQVVGKARKSRASEPKRATLLPAAAERLIRTPKRHRTCLLNATCAHRLLDRRWAHTCYGAIESAEALLSAVAQGLQLSERVGGDAVGHRVFARHLGRLVEARLVVVHGHLV